MDLYLTAIITLLVSYIVAKLVSLATTDTQTTTKHHVHHQPVGPVLQQFTVQTSQTESRVGFIKPVQVSTATNIETEHNTTDATVVSSSNVAAESPPTNSDVAVADAEVEYGSNFVEETVTKGDDSVQQRNEECVEEIMEESLTEKEDEEKSDEEWEWEGIERSEVEKMFMTATEYVGEKGYIGNCDGDLEMELYGLHKVAMEGPCCESQPMPLKLAARAKWNAWQKLGNMSPEVAMERYISLLSDKVPGWMKDTSAGMTEAEPIGSEVSESAAPDLSSALSRQPIILTERELVQESSAQEPIPHTESDLENNVKK